MNWTLTRKDNSASITFPQDMQWSDEFDWTTTAQSTPVRSLSGALIVQQGTKTAGRPITLTGDWVWHKRSDLETLQTWSNVVALEMTLAHYDGRTFNVMFRFADSPLSDAQPVTYITPESDASPYFATINLMTI